MALNINGTTGISGVDGSASAPALTGTDSNTGINFASDTVNINTGGTTRATVDSSGNLNIPVDDAKLRIGAGDDLELYHDGTNSFISNDGGAGNLVLYGNGTNSIVLQPKSGENSIIGNSNSSVDLYYDGTKHFETISNGVRLDSAGDTILEMHTSNAGAHSRIQFSNNSGDNYGGLWYSATNVMEFRTNNAERARIDSAGRLLLNTANSLDNEYRLHTFITSTGGHVFRPDGSSTRKPLAFQNHNGSEVGSVTSSTSSTSYNTSSDYRLKENVVSISDGITRLKTLKPSRFNFIADAKTTVDGFLAHEVTAVPEAISGTKDETQDILYTEEDTIPSGKKVGDVKETVPKYQGIDQSKLVPLLTAALQEAVAKIEVLETKVAALEAG